MTFLNTDTECNLYWRWAKRPIVVASVPARHEPGTGEMNDAFLFAELDRLGYAGFVGCEYNPAAGTEAGLGWFAPYRASQTREGGR